MNIEDSLPDRLARFRLSRVARTLHFWRACGRVALVTPYQQQARDMRKQWDQMISDAIASGLDSTRLVMYVNVGTERHVIKDATLVRNLDGGCYLFETI